MGSIKSEVREAHLSSYPHEEKVIRPFLAGFDVTWAARRRAYNTEASLYFLKPETFIVDLFGFENEVALVVSDYPTLEPRTMQAADKFLGEEPARGRVEQVTFFLVSPANNAEDWVQNYISQNPQTRTPVVFSREKLKGAVAVGDAWFVRNVIGKQLFARDLFDYQLPLDNDLFFFGREPFVAEHLDAIRRSQNRGIFGLRKTGKTSVLYKLRREFEREHRGAYLYYDCKLPSLRGLRWYELLTRVMRDIAKSYELDSSRLGHINERSCADEFIELIRRTPTGKLTVLVFDEIEYISPLAIQDEHWRKDFVPFGQTLWAAQSEIRRLSNLIAGVNPTVVEQDTFEGVQNPMFGVVRASYLTGLEPSDLRKMLRFFGKRMGLRFTDPAIEYLYARYGGHPLLTRLACSHVNSDLVGGGLQRPIEVTLEYLRNTEAIREGELEFYSQHVVSELQQFYKDEYEMLELLATGRKVDFFDLGADLQNTRHLTQYGLMKTDSAGMSEFRIPVIGSYVARRYARQQGDSHSRYVVPSDKRTGWVRNRAERVLIELRQLSRVARDVGAPELFHGGEVPEAERLVGVSVVQNNDSFVAFINVWNRCLVESIEANGRVMGEASYFWERVKANFPMLWHALHRIKVYRHNDLHLELLPQVEEKFREFLREDLDGSIPPRIEDGWFRAQQAVMDGLLLGLISEINNLS